MRILDFLDLTDAKSLPASSFKIEDRSSISLLSTFFPGIKYTLKTGLFSATTIPSAVIIFPLTGSSFTSLITFPLARLL